MGAVIEDVTFVAYFTPLFLSGRRGIFLAANVTE